MLKDQCFFKELISCENILVISMQLMVEMVPVRHPLNNNYEGNLLKGGRRGEGGNPPISLP